MAVLGGQEGDFKASAVRSFQDLPETETVQLLVSYLQGEMRPDT